MIMLRLVRLWRPGRVCWFSVFFVVIVSFVCGYFWLHGLICKLCSCRKEILESALWCRLVQWSNSSVDLLKDSVTHSAIFILQPNTYHYNIFRLLLCFPVLFICCCYFFNVFRLVREYSQEKYSCRYWNLGEIPLPFHFEEST